jgi:hypothetical protein
MLTVISLGAGVQSTTMALMAAHGELTPMPDCAIFADTGAEPQAVYEHLKWLRSWSVLPFPVWVVSEGNLREVIGYKPPKGKHYRVDIPAFVQAKDGSKGTGRRSPRSPVVEQWIGISLDEASRMKPSREAWQKIRWPLIEKRMTRRDCLKWLAEQGYPTPPKSSCTFCPYHSDEQWRALKPDEFADAVALDRRLRERNYRTVGTLYLHRSCKPLDQVDFSTAEERGQLDLFNNECEGMCGV